jgi:hypothetical protein
MKQILFAEEYNQHIPLFFSGHDSGYVHSVFKNGLNIQMGKKLFFIGTTKNGRLPFGIHLEAQLIELLVSVTKANTQVVWQEENKQLCFENGLIVNLEKAGSYTNKLNTVAESKSTMLQHLETFVSLLVNYGEPTGLDVDIEQFIVDYATDASAPNETITRIYTLMEVVLSSDEEQIDNVLRYFLGRGRGLTPSGDDHIVGLLAVHAVTGALYPVFIETAKKIIENESITTDVAREYLIYALRGEFGSPVIDLIDQLVQRNSINLEKEIIKLFTMGHSSGVDTAFGILIGILAIRRLNNG